MTDPKTIYLEPKCQAGEEGQLWCEDDVWSGTCDVCDYSEEGEPQIHTATEYVRADWEPSETDQGLIPIPDGYAEQ